MKKTIIALLALGGVAIGQQETIKFEFEEPSDVINFDNISLVQDWTLTLTLTTTVTTGYNAYGTPILSTEDTLTNGWQLIQIYAGIVGDTVTVKAKNSNDNYQYKFAAGDVNLPRWTATSEKNITLNYDVSSKQLDFSVSDADGQIFKTSFTEVSFVEAGTNKDKVLTQFKTGVTEDMLKDGKWSLPSGSFTYGAAIPEPTTATLSLLALAGLAARRRRK